MNDIDVEAVEEIDDGDEPPDPVVQGDTDRALDVAPGAAADAPEYVLYGGKGGVGKTTCAAATALASAAGGTATLVVSTDPAHSLSDTLGVDIPARPSRVREDVPLYAAEIDPDEAMEAGLFGGEAGTAAGANGENGPADGSAGGAGTGPDAAAGENPLGGLGGMGEALEDGPMGAMLGGTMPGADEAAAMRQLLEHLDDPQFDRVVVDTAPTGHTLRLLQLPELLDSMVGRLMKLRQQFGGMMDGLKGMFGMGEGGPEEPDLDELKDRIERLRSVLRDPTRTDFRVVMVPEEMSVLESERLVERLDEFEIPVGTLVVNRVMEDPSDVAGDAIEAEWVVTPNLDTCEFCQRRWDVQQNALAGATDLFRGRDVKRVPLLADEVRGEDALRVVAACLA
ncbi:ArsA family ATPase [Halorarum halobium]|uniref:ArsA family ATPase n=1 Tax=Halorarum halobium TaxID=3075121 RepID=UPI0028B09202|nr:TRC40/GET3/ArsA family transport-energizing ATPase [Halobaculum sp. XH14]